MALFENQRFIIETAHGTPATAPIDYTDFDIPFEGTFDLILANHMLTHAVHPQAFLRLVAALLAPGGHLYL
jgi:2-polyprenyl-3-methyl-5-hydroxy-6-metoxy-1,4-benzoquinol methylase